MFDHVQVSGDVANNLSQAAESDLSENSVGKTTTPVLMPSLSETTRSGRAVVKPKRLIEEI